VTSTPHDPSAADDGCPVATTYTVLPAGAGLDDAEVGYFKALVERRPGGLWAVTWSGRTLSSTGQWSYPPAPAEADTWSQEHLFGLDEALKLARGAVDILTFNDVTWAEVVHARSLGDRDAAQAHLQACRDRRSALADAEPLARYDHTSTRLDALTHTANPRSGTWASPMTAALAEAVLDALAAAGLPEPSLTRGHDTVTFGWLLPADEGHMLRASVDVSADRVDAAWRTVPAGREQRLEDASARGAAAFVAAVLDRRPGST
jgi:hypothetical protein